MGGTSPGEHRTRIEHLELLGLVARTSRFTRGARKPSAFAESQGPMAPLPGTKKARSMPRPLGNRDSEPPSHRTAPFWTPWLMALSFWSTTVRCLRPVAALDPSEPTARHFTSLKAGACDDQLAHDGAPAQDVDVRAPVRLRPGRFRFVRRPAGGADRFRAGFTRSCSRMSHTFQLPSELQEAKVDPAPLPNFFHCTSSTEDLCPLKGFSVSTFQPQSKKWTHCVGAPPGTGAHSKILASLPQPTHFFARSAFRCRQTGSVQPHLG